jgi:hypothetical protein
MMMSWAYNLDIRQLETSAWYGQMSRPSRCFLHQEEFTFGEHPRKSGCLIPTVKHVGDSATVWAAISCNSILLAPLLPFMAELEGSTCTGWVITCITWSRRYFRTTMQFSKTPMSPFTQLELFSRGLKNIKANFNIFPGQHNHHI